MKRLIIITSVMSLIFTSCDIPQREESTDEQVSEQTEQMMSESSKIVGMPNIVNWNEKKLVRDLYELRDTENLQTWTYIIDMNGQKHFLGRSIGFGIPASVQFSNPERLVDVGDFGISSYQSNDSANLPQPEPNGLFMPEGLSATWVFLLDENDTPRPVYVEPLILVSPFPLH